VPSAQICGPGLNVLRLAADQRDVTKKHRHLRAASVVALLGILWLCAFAGPADADSRGVSRGSANPLTGARFYVDHSTAPWVYLRRFGRSGDTRRATLLYKLARQPYFRWFGTWNHDPQHDVSKWLATAQREQPGTVPELVTFRHIHRHPCGGASYDGGRSEDASYVRWMQRLARGIGNARVVIGYEPDSMGTLSCSPRNRRRARIRMYRRGVDALSRLPNATIYLEAGSSQWRSTREAARWLRRIGVSRVRGFMLNVTHHASNGSNYRFGRRVSRRLHGKPFVISTTTNGRPGPLRSWCDPNMEAAGMPPTTNTGRRGLDAYLWIDRPGYAGQSCGGGAGVFWPDLALRMAANAPW
jgi:endoglucanase